MKVLVTGANGLFGSHIVRALLNDRFTVRVLVRKNSDLRSLKGLPIELCFGELTHKEKLFEAVQGCDFVIHAAARTSQLAELEPFRPANIESTKYICEACLQLGVKRLVFISTANCFGNGSLENPGNESRPFLPWLKNSGYAYSKYLAQQEVLLAVKNRNLDAVVVNPTFILGTNDFKPSSGKIFSFVLNKRIALVPPGGKNFVDARVAARGMVRALQNGTKGECYLLAGENLSYRQFFQLIKNITKQKTLLLPLPRFFLLGLGRLGNFASKYFRYRGELSYINARMLCLENYYSPAKARAELGLEKTNTGETVKSVILWFHSKGYFKK